MNRDLPPGSPVPLLTLGVCLVALLQAAVAAWTQGWTYDEPVHLQWSERLLDSGVTERASQERFNSKTPIVVLNVVSRRLAQAVAVSDPTALRLAARLPSVLWLAALLLTVFVMARSLAGQMAAHLATLGAALDPNLVAHGSLATVDAAYAATTLLTLFLAGRFIQRPTLARGIGLGLALGLAFAAKFSAFLLLPGLLLLPAVVRWPPAPERRKAAAASLLAVLAAWAVICGAYLFKDMPARLPTVRWESAPFKALSARAPRLVLPLPSGFLTGLDASLKDERERDWNVVTLGRRYPQGVWYYFLALWPLKTPVLLLIAQAAGLAMMVRSGGLTRAPWARYLGLNLLLHLAYFSFLFHAQIGFRFVLVCVPLVDVLAASGLAAWTGASLRRTPWAATAVLVSSLVENLLYLGNPLAFTSAALWPKRHAFRLVSNSNIDWGQNRDKIAAWLARARVESHLDPPHVLPGHNTFGLNNVAGVFDFEQHRWLREHADPVGHFGHTYLWFDVDASLYDAFMNDVRRFPPDPGGAALCDNTPAWTRLRPGSQVPLSVSGIPQPQRVWIACVLTKRVTDFALRSLDGGIRVGYYHGEGGCRFETLDDGQVAWYRLEPGLHALCAAERPHRRPWLAHTFDGRWIVRGQGASFGLREGRLDSEGRVTLP